LADVHFMLLDEFLSSPWPLAIGVGVLTLMEILRLLARWRDSEIRLHNLRVEAHTLRLQMKRHSAEQIVAEEVHRASR
jgi:hypothetical protein